MNTPKVYLIKRDLSEEQKEQVQRAISITPLDAIIVTDIRDQAIALSLCHRSDLLARPVGILADFENILTAINEDGSLCPLL